MMKLVMGTLVLSGMAACNLTGTGEEPGQLRDDPSGDEHGGGDPVGSGEQPRRSGSRDFNGDGFDDLIAGTGNGSAQAIAFVKYGNQAGTGGQVLQFTGLEPRARFGWSVAVAGDLNKDGFAELVIGEPSYSGAKGSAYVYFGGPSFDTAPEVRLQQPDLIQTFGRAVAGAGDMNGDGYDDLVVTAHGDARAWVYFGGAGGTLDPVADLELSGPDSWFGQDAASAGDVNGDGFDDLLIGAPSKSNGELAAAFLYLGGTKPSDKPYAVLRGRPEEVGFAVSISGVGDVNGDTFDDFAIGASDSKGRVYFYLGGAGKKFMSADVVIEGTVANQRLGYAVTGAGDLNRDGLSDVIVTAPSYTYIGRPVGEAFVIYGNRTFTGASTVSITSTLDYFGWTANAVGDFNGDGASDVSLSSLDPAVGGKAHVYFGAVGQLIDNSEDLRLVSPVRSMMNVR